VFKREPKLKIKSVFCFSNHPKIQLCKKKKLIRNSEKEDLESQSCRDEFGFEFKLNL